MTTSDPPCGAARRIASRSASSVANRVPIVEAAARCFARLGFKKASIDQIAQLRVQVTMALRQLEEPRAVAARRGLDMDRVVPTRLLRAEAEHSRHEAEIAKAASK